MLFYRLREALVYWDAHRFKRIFASDADVNGAKRFYVLDTITEEKELCFAVSWHPAVTSRDASPEGRGRSPHLPPPAGGIRHYSSFYEVIHTNFVYLVFDLDMSVGRLSRSLYFESSTHLAGHVIERCRNALEDIAASGFEHVVALDALRLRTVSLLSKGLQAVLTQDHDLPEPLLSGVLDATRPSSGKPKFSLHVHTRLGILEHSSDGAAIAAAVNQHCFYELWKSVIEPDADIVTVVLFALVWPWSKLPTRMDEVGNRAQFVDLSIYSKNRVMRMYGQSKLGQSRPLCEVDLTNGRVLDLPCDSVALRECWRSKYKLLIEENGTDIFSVLLSSVPAHFTLGPTARRALACRGPVLEGTTGTTTGVSVNMLRPVASFQDSFVLEFATEQGLCLEPCPVTTLSAREAVDPNILVPARVVSGKSADFTILLSNSTLYNDRGDPVLVEDVSADDILHCPKCDVVSSTGGASPDFKPSMRAFAPNGHDVMMYCFACNVLHIVRNVVDYIGFKDEAFTVQSETGYLTADLVLGELAADHNLLSDQGGHMGRRNRWLVAVNSPMGSGKTEAVGELTRRSFPEGPFVVITYRRALARQLAERFNATCYLDLLECEGPIKADKLVICTNSLGKLPVGQGGVNYALVVIDEGGFVRRHYVQGTFRNAKDRMRSYTILRRIVQQANLVITMQDALSNSDVFFYRSMADIDEDRVRRVYMPRKPLSDVLRSTASEPLWATALKKCISAGNKVFVCCSMRSDAEVLYETIRDPKLFAPGNYSHEGWHERVALITGTSAFPKAKIKDVDEFALNYKDFDVAIATSVLETGVSLSDHYTHVFGHFKRTPITHATQAQLASRVRNAEAVFLLLERGQQLLFTTKLKEIARLLNQDLVSLEDSIFNDTVADIMAEFADTYNNNDSLWREIRHSVSVDDDNDSFNTRLRHAGFLNSDSEKETPSDQEMVRSAIRDTRQQGNESVRRFTVAHMTEEQLDGYDVQAMAQVDRIALATARERLKGHEFVIGKRGTSLYLCLRRLAGITGSSRSMEVRDVVVRAHVENRSRHGFFYMALVDYECALAQDSHDALAVRETAYWTNIGAVCRSNTAVSRRFQIVLSEVKFVSRLVEAMWGSIWPAPGTVFVPTEPELGRVFKVFEGDGKVVSDSKNQEVQWAALGRKTAATVIASIKKKERKDQARSLSSNVRDYSPIQTMSVKRDIRGVRYNGSSVKTLCLNGIALVMAQYNPKLLGLSHTSTVDWIFFKEPVEAIRASIARFKANEDVMKNTETRTKPLEDQVGECLHYGDEDYAKDMESLEQCGFTDACLSLQDKVEEGARILNRAPYVTSSGVNSRPSSLFTATSNAAS